MTQITSSDRKLIVSDYYKNSADDPVFSNSLLKFINPDEGGSPLRLRKKLEGTIEDKDTNAKSNGRIVHLYCKDKEAFAVMPGLPGEGAMKAIDLLIQRLADKGIEPAENIEFHTADLVEAARDTGFGGNAKWGDPVIYKKIATDGGGVGYYNALRNARGRTILTEEDFFKVNGAANAIKNSDERRWLIDEPERNSELETFAREFIICFKLNGHEFKAMLDHLYIDHVRKHVVIRDLKTTSEAVSKFMGFKTYAPDIQRTIFDKGVRLVMFGGAFQRYHYYRQLAVYQAAVVSILPDKGIDYTWEFVIDAVETVEPFELVSCPVDGAWIEAGYQELEECLEHLDEYSIKYPAKI